MGTSTSSRYLLEQQHKDVVWVRTFRRKENLGQSQVERKTRKKAKYIITLLVKKVVYCVEDHNL
jgi:hypothetical protein